MSTTVHVYFMDGAIATQAYGIPNAVTVSYLPRNITLDPRDGRKLPITNVPDNTTGLALNLSEPLFFTDSTFTKQFFDLTEYLFYMGSQTTRADLDTRLAITADTDPFYVTPLKYVTDSLVVADPVTINSNKFLPELVDYLVPKYVSFSLNILDEDIVFKVWFDNAYMVSNFTDSIIDIIIPPMDYATLYAQVTFPTTQADLGTAALTSTHFAQTIANSLQNRDQTDISIITLKYYSNADRYIEIPFAAMYFGHKPGTLVIMDKVREELLNSGVGDEAGWRERLPSLFVSGAFFIVPFWDNKKTVGVRTFHPSHMNVALATTKVGKTLYDVYGVSEYLMMLPIVYDCLTAAILPDPKNKDNRFDFGAEHPTYQDFPTTVTSFKYMTSATQRFAIRLSNCLAVAEGLATDNFFDKVEMDDRIFYSFVAGDLAYYVLDQETYLNLVS